MTQRRFIEHILKLNNTSKDAPEEELRALFEQAAWTAKDIDEAIQLCTTLNVDDQDVASSTVGTFRPDREWSSEQLSSLLGVAVVTNPAEQTELHESERKEESAHATYTVLIAGACALCAVGALGVVLMYVFNVHIGAAR